MSPVVAEETPPSHGTVAATGRRPGAVAALDVCPFLRGRDGSWSSTHASRDLRCWAVRPASQPALHKQRELCVTASHTGCATFAAASAPDPGFPALDDAGADLWSAPAPHPIALEPVHQRAVAGVAASRSGGQALLVGLMAVAFLVLVLARTTHLGSVAEPSASPTASGAPSASLAVVEPAASTTTVPASSSPTPSPATPSPSASSSAAPSPSASQRTYTVKSGDTIAQIAGKFHTTVKAIVAANQIVDPRTIHPGQVLIIP